MIGNALLFASGFTALTYETLWVRQLGLVFGNTAASAATCLAVFFLGMSLGQMAAARRCGGLARPLRTYGLLELLAAGTALTALALPSLYVGLYRSWFDAMTGSTGVANVLRVGLAMATLLPPAFFLGATFPVMVEVEARRTDNVAASATGLYAANTLGGVLGAVVGPFLLAPVVGFLLTYLAVVAANVAIGLAAVAIAEGRPAVPAQSRRRAAARAEWPRPRWAAIAFASGFLALAMEVVWTRMLVQVLHNSVYSFAAVLAVMLVALGLGAALVHTVVRKRRATEGAVAALMVASGIAVVVSATVLEARTDGLAYLGGAAGWSAYVLEVFALAAAVMLVPGVLLGTIFPCAMALSQRRDVAAGTTIGWLLALNTVGSVVGSLATGFVLLPQVGLWRALVMIACAYVLLPALLLPSTRNFALAGAALVLALATPLNPLGLDRVDIDPARDQIVEIEDSAEGSVAVVRRDDVVSIKLNNNYTVGTNANIVNDRRKADLALMLPPEPRSVFFLGMGAGITAAAALDHPVEQVTTCELVPAVARAAERHLGDYTDKLFHDPRSRVLYGDGRAALAASERKFDVVVGDLFVPWHAGVANLYAREHFRSVLDHLAPDGVFAQWLPLYQFTRDQLDIVARTMVEVFPLVTVWRGDLQANAPAVALFGHQSDAPLNLAAVLRNVRRRIGDHGARDAVSEALMLLFYAGNVSESRALFADSPINTDDLPVIEYGAPLAQRRVKAGEDAWMTGERLVSFYRDLERATPPQFDPYLRNLTPQQQGYTRAGLDLFDSFVKRSIGDRQGAAELFQAFRSRSPVEVTRMFESLMSSGSPPPE